MSLEEIIRAAASRAETIRVRNVLNPVLWGCAVATPICGGLAYVLENDPVLRYGFSAAAVVPVLLLAVGYLYFMLRDPDRLQSEEFVLRQLEIRITERKHLPPAVEDVLMIDDASQLPSRPEDQR